MRRYINMRTKPQISELSENLKSLELQQEQLLAEKEAIDSKVAETTSRGIVTIRVSIVAGALCLGLIGGLGMPVLLPGLKQAPGLGFLLGAVFGAFSIGGLVASPIDKKAFPLLKQQESAERKVREVETKIKSVELNLEDALPGPDGKN